MAIGCIANDVDVLLTPSKSLASTRATFVVGMSLSGRLCPLPIPITVVDSEDVERQEAGRNTSYNLS